MSEANRESTDRGPPRRGEDGSPAEPRGTGRWGIVAAAFSVYFVGGGLFNTSTVFFKAIAADLGRSRGELSGVFCAAFVVAGLSVPLWGRVADRRGPRAALLPGAVITGALCVLLSRARGLGSLYVLYAVFAFGSGGISLVPVGVLLSNWFVRKRGRAVGIAYAGGGFGMLLLTPLAGVLVDVAGWRAGYAILGILALSVLVPVACAVRDRPPGGAGGAGVAASGEAGPGGPSRGSSLREALGTPVFWILAASWALSQTALAAVYLHQVPLLTDRGHSIEAASVVAGAVGGTGILGRLGVGCLADTRAVHRLFAACYGMYAAGIALLWAAPGWGFAALACYAAVFGVGVGGSWALGPLMVARAFGLRALGEIFGCLAIFATVGGAVGGVGAGLLFDRTGTYDLALALAFALSLGAVALMPLVGRRGDA